MLKSIFNWLGVRRATAPSVRPAGPPSFEPLEPRLLLSANLIGPVSSSPPEAPLGGAAIHVDLSQQEEGGQRQQTLELFGASPALFVENQGQWSDPSIRYVHDGNVVDVAVTESAVRFLAAKTVSGPNENSGDAQEPDHDPVRSEAADVQVVQFSASFVGAEAVQPAGLDRSRSLFNYFVGDQANWRQDVLSYEVVTYRGLYEGIDLYVQGLRSHLKYEFHVAAGADYRQIVIHYEGIEGLSITEDGTLAVDLGADWGVIHDDAPYIYQEIGGQRVEVAGRFVVLGDHSYCFEVTGTVDPEQELVIDPDLAWSTYLGGIEKDFGSGIAVDTSGNVLVTGLTESSGWTSGGFDTSFAGGRDAFVVKLSPDGAHLWSTYLGGLGWDYGNGIAVDSAGSVYVTGYTNACGWTSGGFDTTCNGASDAFVAKLNSSGTHLWSTYLGGTDEDDGEGIAVDSAGSVYVTGRTGSLGWANGGFDTTYNGGDDAFVTKLSSSGAHLWSTYVGGSEVDYGQGIATDTLGSIYVTGTTFESAGWTSGGFDTTSNSVDAFVVKLDSGGAHLWSTYVGGDIIDYGGSIAVDASGILVTGYTGSDGWTNGGFDTSHNGGWDTFVVKLSPTGVHLWSTYVGGSADDEGFGISVDTLGSVYVTGLSESSGWTSGGFDMSHNGGPDVFVVKLSPDGSHLWSTYMGGSDEDWGWGIATDSSDTVYVVGLTGSTGWVSGGFDTSYNGGTYDAFVARITQVVPGIISNTNSVSVPEGAIGTFQVKLTWQPDSNVTVTISRVDGDSDITVSAGSSLIFTPSSWDTYQTVTLSAAEDADATNGVATIRCSASGLSDEDVTAVELDKPAGTQPVYRFWKASDGTHFYTMKESEKDKLIDAFSHIYTYEGLVFYAYADGQQPVGTLPVYRFWKSQGNTHFYTIKGSEKDKLISLFSHIWTYEGTVWYAYGA